MRILVGALLAILTLAALAPAGEERPSSIVGTVTHHGEGTKAEVTVHRLGGTEIQDQRVPELEEAIVRTVSTDEAGHFDVADLASGFYTLVARKETALAGDAVVCLYAGARSEATIALEPARTLSGVVTWTDGRPVEGIARFRMQMNTGGTSSGPYDPWWDAIPLSLPGPAFETPLVDGTFRIALPARSTSVTIDTPDGFRILGRGGWSTNEDKMTVAWTVSVPEATVAGRVVNEAGTAVPGATVRATHHEQDRAPVQTVATSGPDGRFALRVVSTPADVWITAEGHARKHDAAFEGGDLALARHSSAVVEGRVVRSGKPVRGAIVHVVPTSRMAREWWADARFTRSDADGRYRIADVPAVPAAVFVRGGRFASVDLASVRARGSNPFGIDLAAGEVATRILDVEPALGLLGRVVDHEDRAVVGATILALGVTDVQGQAGFQNRLAVRAHVGPFVATTDADGRFAYHDLVPGHLLAMRVDAPGMPQLRVVLRPGADSALSELRFARPRTLTVRLVEAKTGSAVPEAWVHLATFGESRRTDADGIARFGPLGDGAMSLQVRAEGFVPVTAMGVDGSTDGPGPFDVTVTLERGLTITGRVLDEDGTPLGGAHVSALHRTDRRSGLHAHTTTDTQGEFTLQGLFAGTWDLRAEVIASRRRNRRQAEAEAEAGATDVTLRFDKTPADSRVFTIRVTDPDGNPIPSARARLVGFRGSSPRGAVRDGVARLDAEAIDPREFEEGHVYAYVSGAQKNNAGERPPPWASASTVPSAWTSERSPWCSRPSGRSRDAFWTRRASP